MKILYLLQDRNFFSRDHNVVGGHISHILGVLNAFRSLGHELVLATYDKIPFWKEEVKQVFFPYFRINIPVLSGIVYHWSMTRMILKVIKQETPDIVYVRWSSNIFFYLIRKKNPDLKIILECNSLLQMNKSYGIVRGKMASREDRIMVETATIIGVVSKTLKESVLKGFPSIPPSKIVVNSNGVDSDRFVRIDTNLKVEFGFPEDRIVIGFSGNFASWHRIDLLIKTVQELDQEVILLLIGTGQHDILKSLKEMAAERHPHRIVFTGAVPFSRMPEYLSICEILAMPQDSTDNHRSPIKLFEYMSMGIAVVAADIGQISEVISNRENGLLFAPDGIESFKGALEELINDQELREKLGKNARKDAVLKYSWEANVRRLIDPVSNK